MVLTLNGMPFTSGQTTYYDLDPTDASRKSAIYVQVVLPIDSGISLYAPVDTGAPYCIFETEIVEALGLSSDSGEKIRLRTPYGLANGTIQRIMLRLVAERGDSLDIDASVYVPDDDWRFGNFLGYAGFLERLRFAVDPTTNAFYFGACEG
jgi:hypothetical protein